MHHVILTRPPCQLCQHSTGVGLDFLREPTSSSSRPSSTAEQQKRNAPFSLFPLPDHFSLTDSSGSGGGGSGSGESWLYGQSQLHHPDQQLQSQGELDYMRDARMAEQRFVLVQASGWLFCPCLCVCMCVNPTLLNNDSPSSLPPLPLPRFSLLSICWSAGQKMLSGE